MAKAKLAKAKGKTKSTKASVGVALKGVSGVDKPILTELVTGGKPVRVVGRVKDGKIQLDEASLNEFAAQFPKANMTFVAVNAPFDPLTHYE